MALASLTLHPDAHAGEKKKPAPAEEVPGITFQRWLDHFRPQPRLRAVPVGVPVTSAPPVKVRLWNYTGHAVEMVSMNPNGVAQPCGLAPASEPGSAPTTIDTVGSHKWVFKTEGHVIQTFTAGNQPLQEVRIGQPPSVQIIPPDAHGSVPRHIIPSDPLPPAPRAVAVHDDLPPPVDTLPPFLPEVGVVDDVPPPVGNMPPPLHVTFGAAPEDAQEFLRVHNAARARVGVPPLRWSPELARFAQQWADQIEYHGGFRHRDLSKTGLGENLFRGSEGHTAADAALYWLAERAEFDGETPRSQHYGLVGHYTQMVWRETTKVGFGIARGRYGVVVVANYAPGGNRNGRRPY